MSSFTDWATLQGISITTSHPEFSAIGQEAWARSDRGEVVRYIHSGDTLVTETWNAFHQGYMATNTIFGRVSAGSGTPEEIPHPWPINSIFFGAVDTNPATLISIGTWSSLSTGNLTVGSTSFTVYAWKRTA